MLRNVGSVSTGDEEAKGGDSYCQVWISGNSFGWSDVEDASADTLWS
jgi:hypothetical protein